MSFVHAQAGPTSVNFLRAYVFGLWFLIVLFDPLSDLSRLPPAFFAPAGFLIKFLPGTLQKTLLTTPVLLSLKAALVIVLTATFMRKFFLPASLIACFLLTLQQSIIHSFGDMNHAELILLYAAYAVSFFAAADKFVKDKKEVNLNSAPFIVILAAVCCTYSFVGITRVAASGMSIFSTDSMVLWTIKYTNLPSNFTAWRMDSFVLGHTWMKALLIWSFPLVTLFEILAPLALVYRRFRHVLAVFMSFFHLFTWILMDVFFWETMALLVLFFDTADAARFKQALKPCLLPGLRKTLRALPHYARQWQRRVSGKPYRILFYPRHPHDYDYEYAINYISHVMGFKMLRDPQAGYDVCMYWDDETFARPDKRLDELNKQGKVINAGCRDISKQHVDRIFTEVFKYSSFVNPLEHKGPCVQKSNLNGTQDGKILNGPVTNIEKECVYQKLIETSLDGEFVLDLRVPVFGSSIPFVFLKYKPANARFCDSVKGTWAETTEVFSTDEVGRIMQFCRKIGLECGELDVLRDTSDGRIYIVDANKTPTVRFVSFSGEERHMLLKRQGRAFEGMFLKNT